MLFPIFTLHAFFSVCVQTIDQGGGGSGVFQNIWQQNVNNMNQMIGGSQMMGENPMITGEFSPCNMKFTGPNSQLNYGNQFGNFKPGTVIGKRSAEHIDCQCIVLDANGCPTCPCQETTKGNWENQLKPTTSRAVPESTASPTVYKNSASDRGIRTTDVPTTRGNIEINVGHIKVPETDQMSNTISSFDKKGPPDELGVNIHRISWNDKQINSSGEISAMSLPPDNVYFGIITGLSVVLLVFMVTTFFFLYKWRKSVKSLKHEQNELYFAEKSFRISLEKQHCKRKNVPKLDRSRSTSTNIPSPDFVSSPDSVFTVDAGHITDTQCTSPKEQFTLTPSVPLITPGNNVFKYPPEAYRHEYLELM